MRVRNLLLGLLFLVPLNLLAADTKTTTNETSLLHYSGTPIEDPFWFKDSFLELADDIEEAEEEGKKLLVYFHQAGCPYCFNFVQQSLLDPQLSQFIQENFDVIALNLWGDREVTLPNGDVLSEKDLAKQWKVQYTPTLIFFSGEPEPVLRIDGYRSKEVTAKIFDYVLTGDTKASLAQRMITVNPNESLYPSARFKQASDLSVVKSAKPVAILFEYPGCSDCDQLHRRVLSRTDTDQQLDAFDTYRIDVSSESPITTPGGERLSPKQWAKKLGITFFPSTLLLDANLKEQFRVDSYVQSYHYNTALEYVSSKTYERLPEFQRYINERADRLRESGKKVIITQ